MLWALLFLFMACLSIAGFLYVASRSYHFSFVARHLKKRTAFFCSAGLLAAVLGGLWLWGGPWNAMIVFMHLLLFWLALDGIFLLLAKLRRRQFRRYWAGICAIVITAGYLTAGFYAANHVRRTCYSISTASLTTTDTFRIAVITDSHMGAVFGAEKLAEYVSEINRQEPDIVVIVGDYVDDDTKLSLMLDSCAALGGLQTKYGVYFVYGNHDYGYYDAAYRGYDKAVLAESLTENGVTILEDVVVRITDDIWLCGRQDARQKGRSDMQELAGQFPESGCVIVLDHEPTDYEAEAQSGADLVISGHTHGGQFIPINHVGEWLGINDMTYGEKKIGNTEFIVSSGIADWVFKFKTGCFSEYVIIDLTAA